MTDGERGKASLPEQLPEKDTHTKKTKRQNEKVANCIGKNSRNKEIYEKQVAIVIQRTVLKRKSIDAKGKLETFEHYAY